MVVGQTCLAHCALVFKFNTHTYNQIPYDATDKSMRISCMQCRRISRLDGLLLPSACRGRNQRAARPCGRASDELQRRDRDATHGRRRRRGRCARTRARDESELPVRGKGVIANQRTSGRRQRWRRVERTQARRQALRERPVVSCGAATLRVIAFAIGAAMRGVSRRGERGRRTNARAPFGFIRLCGMFGRWGLTSSSRRRRGRGRVRRAIRTQRAEQRFDRVRVIHTAHRSLAILVVMIAMHVPAPRRRVLQRRLSNAVQDGGRRRRGRGRRTAVAAKRGVARWVRGRRWRRRRRFKWCE